MKKYDLITFLVLIGVVIVTVFFLLKNPNNETIILDKNNSVVLKKDDKLKIASFNIQVLGRSKMKKPEVVEKLVKILARYDIIFVQELRDRSGLAIKKLLTKLNKYSNSNYKIVISDRLGLTSSKEQYVFFIRIL